MAQRSKFTIRTSDRRVFRRCFRKWEFQSSLKGNLQRIGSEQNINFWFGSGIHFALEDYHGWNRFEDPRRAFHAYYNAFKEDERPAGAEFHYDLAMAMLSYYITWYERHNAVTKFTTVWLDAKGNPFDPGTPGTMPACEVKFYIPLKAWAVTDIITDEIYETFYDELPIQWHENEEGTWDTGESSRVVKIVPIMYHGTIDKIVKDGRGRYWIVDYKTAKGADTNKLATDDQISAYMWAATAAFPFPIYGFVYHQLTKVAVNEPKVLKNGELSTDKRQKTTYSLLKQAVINTYGAVRNAPDKIIEFVNYMAEQEEPEGDKFIRWDFVERNKAQIQATELQIYSELRLMLNKDLMCFPSPTRDCIWDCPFRDICIATDRGELDTVTIALKEYEKRPRDEDGNEQDEWRQNIKWPTNEKDLIPLQDILNYTACIQIEGSLSEEDDKEGFKFVYEEEC